MCMYACVHERVLACVRVCVYICGCGVCASVWVCVCACLCVCAKYEINWMDVKNLYLLSTDSLDSTTAHENVQGYYIPIPLTANSCLKSI